MMHRALVVVVLFLGGCQLVVQHHRRGDDVDSESQCPEPAKPPADKPAEEH